MAGIHNEVICVGVWLPSWTCFCWIT